jgi:hypothetical protein
MVQHIQKPDVLLFQYLYKRHFKLPHMLLCSRSLPAAYTHSVEAGIPSDVLLQYLVHG